MQFNGQINSPNGIANVANPVYYSETITGLSVTQVGWLPCTVYPTVGVYVERDGAELTLSNTQLSAGSVINIPFSFSTLQAGDVATAQQTAPGQGCPFSPLVVTLTAQYTVTLSANLSSLADVATLANPVYYTESITALSVTQAGWLPCTIYPTVGGLCATASFA